MSEFWQHVFGFIASVGGAGVIIGFVVKFAANRIADRMSDKYKAELNGQIETLKADLSNRNHSFQAKFDKEFGIYGKLVPALLELTEKTYWLFPYGFDYPPQDEDEKKAFYQKRYEAAFDSLKKAQYTLGGYSVFVPEEIYNSINEYYRLCKLQFDLFPNFGPMGMKDAESNKIRSECYKRSNEISSKYDELIRQLRSYICDQLK